MFCHTCVIFFLSCTEPGSTREQEKEEVVVVRKEVKQPEPERIEKPGAKRQRRQKAGEPPQEDTKVSTTYLHLSNPISLCAHIPFEPSPHSAPTPNN